MKLTEKETAALYREMTARGDRGADCLDDEILLRAATNDLGARDRERIASHIARCSDCAREYRVARAMQPFREQTRAAVGVRLPRWWPAAAAAAAVLVVIAAYAWQTADTVRDLRATVAFNQAELANARRQLARSRTRTASVTVPRPQVGVPIVDLDPEPTRGAGAAGTSVDISPDTDELALVLHVASSVSTPAAIEIDGPRGVIWRGTATRVDSGTITLVLPRALIPSGQYSVLAGSTRFPFRVTWR